MDLPRGAIDAAGHDFSYTFHHLDANGNAWKVTGFEAADFVKKTRGRPFVTPSGNLRNMNL